jgi:hypothetical protein
MIDRPKHSKGHRPGELRASYDSASSANPKATRQQTHARQQQFVAHGITMPNERKPSLAQSHPNDHDSDSPEPQQAGTPGPFLFGRRRGDLERDRHGDFAPARKR